MKCSHKQHTLIVANDCVTLIKRALENIGCTIETTTNSIATILIIKEN